MAIGDNSLMFNKLLLKIIFLQFANLGRNGSEMRQEGYCGSAVARPAMRAKATWGALSGGPAALRSRAEPSRHESTLPERHIP